MLIKSLLIGTLFFGISVSSITAYAAPKDGDIIIHAENGIDEGIFSDRDGLWQPGMNLSKGFIVTNNSDDDIKIKKFNLKHISLKNNTTNKELLLDDIEHKKTMENCIITILDGNKEIFKGNLNKAFDKNGIKLSNDIVVKNGEKKNFKMNFSINKEADNDLQDLRNEFNIAVNYELLDSKTEGEDNSNNSGNDSNIGSSGQDSSNNTLSNSMPKTGALVGTATSALIGIGVLSLGTFFVIKNKKKEGDRDE